MSHSAATELEPIAIDRALCDLCGACVGMCAPDSILIDHSTIAVDQESCTLCMKCVPTCPVTAISGGKT